MPTIEQLEPYLKVIGVIVGMTIFFLALWIIWQINASSNSYHSHFGNAFRGAGLPSGTAVRVPFIIMARKV